MFWIEFETNRRSDVIVMLLQKVFTNTCCSIFHFRLKDVNGMVCMIARPDAESCRPQCPRI